MPDDSEEQEATAENHRIIERLRQSFRSSELRLTHEVEPATLFSVDPIQEEAE